MHSLRPLSHTRPSNYRYKVELDALHNFSHFLQKPTAHHAGKVNLTLQHRVGVVRIVEKNEFPIDIP